MSFANYLDIGSKRLNREDSTCQGAFSMDITRAGVVQGYNIPAGTAGNQQFGIGLHTPSQLDNTPPNGGTKNVVFKGWIELSNMLAGSVDTQFVIRLCEEWDTNGSTTGPGAGAPVGNYFPAVITSAAVSSWSICGVVAGSTSKSANDYTEQAFTLKADSHIVVPIMIQGYAPTGDQWNEIVAKDLATGLPLPGLGAIIMVQPTAPNPTATEIAVRYQIWSSVEAGNQTLHT